MTVALNVISVLHIIIVGFFPSFSTQNSSNVWFSYAKTPANFSVDKSGLCRTGWRVSIDEN